MIELLKKQKWRIVRYISMIIIVSCFFIILIAYQKDSQMAIEKESLQLLANEKANQISVFFDAQKDKVSILQSMDVFKDAVKSPNDNLKIQLAREKQNKQ